MDDIQPTTDPVRPKSPLRSWFDVRGRSMSTLAFALNRLTAVGLTIYLFLQDPLLVEATRDRIYSEKINAEAAWQRETAAMAATYREMADDYMRARAADVEDVAQRVLRGLMGVAPPSLDFAAPAILIAADLTPSDTARLDRERVLAVCTELGGATAHSAILARALGIPAVVGLGHAVWQAVSYTHLQRKDARTPRR